MTDQPEIELTDEMLKAGFNAGIARQVRSPLFVETLADIYRAMRALEPADAKASFAGYWRDELRRVVAERDEIARRCARQDDYIDALLAEIARLRPSPPAPEPRSPIVSLEPHQRIGLRSPF